MNNEKTEYTFGSFLQKHRRHQRVGPGTIYRLTRVKPSHLTAIENNECRPAVSEDFLELIVIALRLEPKDRATIFDLHEKAKSLPKYEPKEPDIVSFVPAFARKPDGTHYTKEDLEERIENMRREVLNYDLG